MAHFAKINGENIVTNIVVCEPEVIASGEMGDPNDWVQYSYNTDGGKYYVDDEETGQRVLGPDQSKAFRYNGAFIGAQWDPDAEPDGAFYEPRMDGFDSWTLNTTSYKWEPPIPLPEDCYTFDGDEYIMYIWDDAAYQADNTQGWVRKPLIND